MRIGYLSVFNYGSNIGGVENHIYFMAKELTKLGHEILIFQPVEIEKYIVESKIVDDVKVIFIPVNTPKFIQILSKYNGNKLIGFFTAFINKAKYIKAYKLIANKILEYNCDVVHQHDFISNIFTTKYLSKKGIKTVLTNHTGEYLFFEKNFFGRLLLKFFLSHYKFVIGPSKELTPLAYNKNSYTIYNGVDLNIFFELNDDEKSILKSKYNISNDDYIVLCPRRWAPTKGVIYLIQSIIENDYPKNYIFLFAGSDYDGYIEYSKKINSMIANSNKKSQIKKLGNLNIQEMQEVYNIADIVIIPSLMEAVSLSAVEAMATGTPVISTNVGGMPELIKNEVNGLLINPKASNEIYNAILSLSNRELYENIYSSSLQTAKEFSWSSIAYKTHQLYEGLNHD
jgi:glycosyltransferase involved in cell wall biosynthesis